MLEDALVFAALLAGLVSFGWAVNHVLNQVNVPVDPTCFTPSECFQLLAETL